MDKIKKYFDYIEMFPKFFLPSHSLKIITDKKEIEEYALNNDTDMGVIHENKYFAIIVDLLETDSGTRYASARIINRNGYNGVVIIPIYNEKIVLLQQFRHGTRKLEIELPRGFSEPGLSPEKNAIKEIFEEIGGKVSKIESCGSIISDSGLTGGQVHVFICNIDSIRILSGEEGIEGYKLLSVEEIEELIYKGIIRDAFTISAISKFKIFKKMRG